MSGGYDDGYRQCPCFWGTEPGSLVKQLLGMLDVSPGLRVLDVGCGEGKNAAPFAARGAKVRAIDVSSVAIDNACNAWRELPGIQWEIGDVGRVHLPASHYNVVVAYGLLHCLASENEIAHVVTRLKNTTRRGGYHVICAFNRRAQDLSAHPGFTPCLVDHEFFIALYDTWEILHCTDSDLWEVHPHNLIPHSHSLTRLIARRP